MSFLDLKHPDYEARVKQWEYAWDHYTGEYAGKGKVQSYLSKKEQAEADEAYKERLTVTDPVLLFPTAVDSLNGILFGKSDKTEREWGDLGDPGDSNSTAYKILHNADGKGTNWQPLMKKVAIKQTVMHKVWGLVDGVTRDEGQTISEASVHVLNPQSVVNWFPSSGMPTEVLVREMRDGRSSIQDEAEPADTYVLYTLDGWTRYRQSEDGPEVTGSGAYEYYSDSTRTQRILPIFPIEIPMPRDIGYLLAQKQNHIFNFKSIRDFSVRNMSFAFLQFVGDSTQYEEFLDKINKGFRVLRKDPDTQGEHGYKSPDSSYLGEAGQILDKDTEAFMESAFRSYGDAARQVTATEIRQESRSGVEAFLTLLVSSIDEFENHCLHLLEQVYFPDQPSSWGKAFVRRNDDFQPEDKTESLRKVSEVIRNVSDSMSIRKKVELLHPGMTDDEIEEEVERINTERGATIPDPFIGP